MVILPNKNANPAIGILKEDLFWPAAGKKT
jgi:hypothetical protein